MIAAASALVLPACDGDTAENNDYVDQVNEVSSALANSAAEIPTAGGSPKQVSSALEQVSASLNTAAADLTEIEPPPEVADLHARLIADFTTLKDKASNAANEVASGGAAGAVGVTAQFRAEATRIGGRIDSTIDQINSELQS